MEVESRVTYCPGVSPGSPVFQETLCSGKTSTIDYPGLGPAQSGSSTLFLTSVLSLLLRACSQFLNVPTVGQFAIPERI